MTSKTKKILVISACSAGGLLLAAAILLWTLCAMAIDKEPMTMPSVPPFGDMLMAMGRFQEYQDKLSREPVTEESVHEIVLTEKEFNAISLCGAAMSSAGKAQKIKDGIFSEGKGVLTLKNGVFTITAALKLRSSTPWGEWVNLKVDFKASYDNGVIMLKNVKTTSGTLTIPGFIVDRQFNNAILFCKASGYWEPVKRALVLIRAENGVITFKYKPYYAFGSGAAEQFGITAPLPRTAPDKIHRKKSGNKKKK